MKTWEPRSTLTVDRGTAADAVAGGHDGLAITQLFLGVRDDEGHGFAVWCKVVQVARGLGVREVLLGVRTGLHDENLQLRVCISESAGDETGSRSAYRAKSQRSTQVEIVAHLPPAKMMSNSALAEDI